MKKLIAGFTCSLVLALVLFGMVVVSHASLVTIGTASYDGGTYNLIYDDDDNGHGGGGLVWLDYTNSWNNWSAQLNWAYHLGSSLSVTLNPGYTTTIDWSTGWRLPDTVDGPFVNGYEGDPNNDGIYTYTVGYNLANSEMGHLFYTELGNIGYQNTDGTYNSIPPESYRFLQNTGPFSNLEAKYYWSIETSYSAGWSDAWYFYMISGAQGTSVKYANLYYALAVHPGQVSAVPIPGTIWFLGSGLLGLVAVQRRKKE